MTMVHYTAEVKSDLLLALPEEARQLSLHPGDKIEVQFEAPVLLTAKADVIDATLPTVEQQICKTKELRGRGMLAGVLSTEAFLRRKQEEIALEERQRL